MAVTPPKSPPIILVSINNAADEPCKGNIEAICFDKMLAFCQSIHQASPPQAKNIPKKPAANDLEGT